MRSFEEAQAAAEEQGGSVCGTYLPDGTPVYFVVNPDAPAELVAEVAFEAKHDRRMNDAEFQLRRLAGPRLNEPGQSWVRDGDRVTVRN